MKVTVSPCIADLQDLHKQLQNLNYVKSQLDLVLPFSEYSKVSDKLIWEWQQMGVVSAYLQIIRVYLASSCLNCKLMYLS